MKIGMYGETPQVKIGKYTISRMCPNGEDDSVWIQKEDGEGGQFFDTDLEPVIEAFFNKKF